MDKSISIQEAAEALSVHPTTIRRMIFSGELPAFRVRRVWRIRLSEVQKVTEKEFRSEGPGGSEAKRD